MTRCVTVASSCWLPLAKRSEAVTAATIDHVVDAVVGIEARGFILGAATAYAMGVGFVPVRKAGKLPGETYEATYTLEYGTATLEIHVDAFVEGQRVLIMDDVLATGGTAAATCELVERAGGQVVAVDVVLEIGGFNGREARVAEGGAVCVIHHGFINGCDCLHMSDASAQFAVFGQCDKEARFLFKAGRQVIF